jgi:multiple sugar transport system permease protein
MTNRAFYAFVGPSMAVMILFIALPLFSVFWQSLHSTRRVFRETVVETCSPGFMTQTCTRETRSDPVLDENGRPVSETRFSGLDSYRLLLAPEIVGRALNGAEGAWHELMRLDFYRALRFTLTFALITLPFVVGIGLALALVVDTLGREWRGPVIFVSLLPYVITPVIGALSIRWLFIGDGIVTAAISWIVGTKVSFFAQGWTIEILMLFYRIWHVAPFAFVVFYAGLQTLDASAIEAATIDGADRTQKLRYIVVPHLMPLIVFVSLIHLMDSYRVFEEIIGFSSQAHRISLQWLTFHYLTPDHTGNRAISRASASAMLTIIGVAVLLMPLVIQTWRDRQRED